MPRSFSWTSRLNDFVSITPTRTPFSRITEERICLFLTSTRLHLHNRSQAHLFYRRPSWTQTNFAKLGNIDPMSIAYAFQPQLRSRLTLPGRPVCRNPWAYGDQDSHLIYRYSCQQQLLSYLHLCSRSGFIGLDNVPLPRKLLCTRIFGFILKPRYVFGATPLDQ